MRTLISLLATIFLTFSANSQCLIAHYTLDNNGNDKLNAASNSLSTAIIGDKDRFNQIDSAISFNGISSVVNTQRSFDFQNRTISVWFKSKGSLSGQKSIIAQDSHTLTYGAFEIRLMDSTLFANAGGSTTLISSSIDTGAWYHLVMSRSASTTSYYLNGSLVAAGTPSSSGSVSQANPNLIIGADRSTSSRFFEGTIDDLRIFNCVLDSSAVLNLFSYFPKGCQTVLNMPLDGSIFDSTGISNPQVYGTPIPASNRFNLSSKSLEFDGNNDFIDTRQSYDCPDRTVSFWFKINSFPTNNSGYASIIVQDAASLIHGSFEARVFSDSLILNAGGNPMIMPFKLTQNWYHVALVRNKDSVKYYVNGSLLSADLATSNGSFSFANPNFIIGADRSLSRYFSGLIDDLKITCCEKSAQDIKAEYDLGKTGHIVVDKSFSIYPNPASNFISLEYQKNVQHPVHLTFYSASGKIVKENFIYEHEELNISTSELSKGLYYLKAEDKTGAPIGFSPIILE